MKIKNITATGFLILTVILMGSFVNPAPAAETYKLDPDHTSIIFRIKHLGVAYVYGQFGGPTGSFVFDESSPANSSIQIQVDAKNVDTAVAKRDNHLKSPDFFDAGEHPLIKFKSTSEKPPAADSKNCTGHGCQRS
jgi:polyisoprenoid-binding protein YceI